jgi:hypothetical protein
LDKEKLPNALYCPLTMNLFQVPVIAEDGHTYEEKAILAWFESCRAKGEAPSSPLCGRLKISPGGLVPNLLLSRVIEDALEQKRKNLQGDQPAVIRGIGDTSVEEILRAFSERLRNYFLPVAELATALSAEIIPAVTLSSQGDFEGGSQVLLVPTLNLVSAAFEASTEAVRDFSSTVIPRLLSSPKSGGGGAAKSSEREGDLQTSSFSRGR